MSIFDTLKDVPFDEDDEKLTDWCSGKRNRFYGQKHTEETKELMSETLKQQYADGRVPHNKGKFKSKVSDHAVYMRKWRENKRKNNR